MGQEVRQGVVQPVDFAHATLVWTAIRWHNLGSELAVLSTDWCVSAGAAWRSAIGLSSMSTKHGRARQHLKMVIDMALQRQCRYAEDC